jgi:hypothetical protein
MAIPGNFLSDTTSRVDPNTSGWAAKLNCAIALGSGGRVGDGVLKLTSSASGEMQARTFSSYGVVPGQVYWAFADASGATVPERIGIRWLTWLNQEISVTWSVTTASASASWHRISVAGAAPAGAARAQVLVSATPAASGVINYFENVYLGYPLRFPGNLLSFNAESGGEIDLSAWGVETNCTLSRLAPVFSYSESFYYAGGETVGLTVTANGNASALCVERAPVTPGTDYLGSVFVNPPTSGSTCWVELRFYDAGGSQISATRANLAAPGTGMYSQIVSAVAPSNAATASLAVGITSGTAGQVMRTEGAYIGTVAVATAANRRTGNVLPMADWSFEAGVGGWTVNSGVATLARSTPWGGQAYYDAYSLTVSSATATTSVIRSPKYPVAELLNWRLETYSKVTAGGWTWIRRVRWYNTSDAEISASSSSSAAVPTPNWWLTSDDFTAPAAAVTGLIEYSLTATSASSTLQLDALALWQVLPLTAATTSDADGNATLTLRELTTGQVITVTRVLSDGSSALVRGASGLLDKTPITADTLAIEDNEAPMETQVSYRVEMWASDGLSSYSTRTSDTITIHLADANECWLKDPGRPERNQRIRMITAPDWKRPINQAEYRVRGRRNSVVLSDVRGGLQGDLVADTLTDGARASLHLLLDAGTVLLLQTAGGLGLEDAYVCAGEVTEGRLNPYGKDPRRRWTLAFTQSDMPLGGVAGPAGRTWQDVELENTTWGDVLSRYETWRDVLLGTRKAG